MLLPRAGTPLGDLLFISFPLTSRLPSPPQVHWYFVSINSLALLPPIGPERTQGSTLASAIIIVSCNIVLFVA